MRFFYPSLLIFLFFFSSSLSSLEVSVNVQINAESFRTPFNTLSRSIRPLVSSSPSLSSDSLSFSSLDSDESASVVSERTSSDEEAEEEQFEEESGELDSVESSSPDEQFTNTKKPNRRRAANPPLRFANSVCGASGQRAKNAPSQSSTASKSDLAKSHTRADDCWVLINGELLDISNLDHPVIGGVSIIADKKACGNEVASELKMKHSDLTLEKMKLFRILPECNFEFAVDQRTNGASLYSASFNIQKARGDVKKASLKSNIEKGLAGKSPKELLEMLKQLDAGAKVPI
jgi:hypothetical protein